MFKMFLLCNYARICSIITKNSKQNNCDNTSWKKYVQLTNKQWKCWIIEWICTIIHFKVHFRSPYDKSRCVNEKSVQRQQHLTQFKEDWLNSMAELYTRIKGILKRVRREREREREREMQFSKIEREREKYVLEDPLGSLQKNVHKIPNSLGLDWNR